MDYLYINAIVNETYLDLACGCAFPETYRRRLSSYVPNDDFLNTRAVENVFSYFTIKDSGKAPLLVLANVERQKNCASVGRATQVLGWEWDGKLIEKNMDAIFSAQLYTENEIDSMVAAQQRIPLPKNGAVPGLKKPITMDFKTRKAILTAAFIRWLRHDDVLRIAVPAGVDYNSYVWQAMKQIYAFFPVGLRAEAGFCSYLPDVKKAGSRISFGFIPENIADSKTLFLDGSRRSALTAYENGTERRMLDQLIEFICGVDAETCQGFLEEVYMDLEGAGNGAKLAALSARDYQPMGEAVDLLVANEGPDRMMQRWKAFFAEQEKYSPSMRQRIGQKISSQIEPAGFCQTYAAECRDAKAISAVFEILKSYDAFCRVSRPLADAMWDATVKILREKGASYKRICDAVSSARKDLAAVLTEDKMDHLFAMKLNEDWQPLKNQSIKSVAEAEKALKTTDDLYRTLRSSQRNQYTVHLLKEVEEFRALAETLMSDYAVNDLTQKFVELSRQSATTMPQMKAQMEQGRKLLEQLKPHRNSEKKAALESQIHGFLNVLKEKTGASDAKMGHIYSIINRNENYFAILEQLVEAERDTLDQSCIQEMHAALQKKCPQTRYDYDSAYKEKYGCPVTMESMAERPEFVCKVIVSDLSRINAVSVKYSLGDSRDKNLTKIDRAKFAGKMISADCAVEVLLGGNAYDGEWFRKLLKLEHTAETMQSRKMLKEAFFTLVEAGVYAGDDLSGCLRMISQCDLKFMEFFPMMIQGKIVNTSSKQYLDAFEQILKYNKDKNPETLVRKMSEICDEQDRDKTAYKAFLKFAGNYQSGGKKKLPKWVLPAAIGGGVLLLILVGLLLWFLLRDKPKDDPKDPTAPSVTQGVDETQAPTEPEKTFEEPLHAILAHDAEAADMIFGNSVITDFESYNLGVQAYLDKLDEATQLQILDAYKATEDKPLGLDDRSVSAEEYFFWLLWFNARNIGAEGAVTFDPVNFESEALSVLRVIHYALPTMEVVIPEEPATETGTESTPASSEPSAPAADEAVSGSEPTEAPTEPSTEAPTEAPTEPPITMAEFRVLITEAARVPFEAAKTANTKLPLILKLFGKDLTKTFDEHLEKVNSFFNYTPDHQAALLSCYNNVPEGFVLEGMEDVTWNEYAFWKFWLMANGEAASFDDPQAHEKALEILKLLSDLPGDKSFDRSTIGGIFADEAGSSEENANAEVPTGSEPLNASEPSVSAESTAPSDAGSWLVPQVENMGTAARPAFEAALEAYIAAVKGVGAAG